MDEHPNAQPYTQAIAKVAQPQQGDSVVISIESQGENIIERQGNGFVEPRIAENRNDSTGPAPAEREDTARTQPVYRPPFNPQIDMAIESVKRSRNWQMLLSGALSPALAQNIYRIIQGNDKDTDVSDLPTNTGSSAVWEQLGNAIISNDGYTPHERDSLLNSLWMDCIENNGDIFDRASHERPITFGLSLSKQLGGRWSMESGLSYTQLRSTFEQGQDANFIRRRQRIHYIGLPLRVSYRIAGSSRISAYAAAGAQLNIPVSGETRKTYVIQGTAISQDTVRSLTPPMQWSVNASLGVQWQFVKHWSIYAEPTFNYQLPAGGDVHTIWTERPFTVTVPLGIRFKW